MGTSKTHRGAPGWQSNNTVGGASAKVSRGNVVNCEGTHMSGSNGGRAGLRKGSRMKSRSSKGSLKSAGIYGQS